jgi:ubiquitin carboxyl-terminal hydrolase 36/42
LLCAAQHPRTLVNEVFSGILQSQVTCLSCRHVSATYDPCMDLSLELGGCSSVEDALRRFTAVERLDGDNKYRCGVRLLVPSAQCPASSRCW